ncbi:MAG: hypothetical protein M3R22_09890, partial [Pseudomonadota bacterium]|nr:hypothetical protein [Pseudomonadota bacterium]
MQRVFLHFAMGAAVLMSALSATAMGFGPSVTQTTLGQRLNFVASVMLDADESIPHECLFADVFAGDAKVSPENVRVVLEPSSNDAQRNIRVTTQTRIDEPVVTIEVSVGCTSRMSRRFVAFIDPPAVQLAEASPPSDTAPPATTGRDTQSMMLSDMARNADTSRRRGASAASDGDDLPARRSA